MHREPQDYQNRPLYDRLSRKRFQARLVLGLENLVGAFWRISLWIGAFAGLWLLQLPAIAGKTGAIATSFIFIGGLVWLLWKDARRFHWPTMQEIDRRLEDNSQLPHRPLTALDDKLANPDDAAARTLWARSKSRALAAIYKLKTPFPRPVLASRDPVALRALVVLIVIIGITIAGPAWKERIQFGINPLQGLNDKKIDKSITVWITPPEYTGVQQTILQGGGKRKESLDIPQDSVIKVQVSKGWGDPVLRMAGSDTPLKRIDDKNWSLETAIAPGEKLEVRQLGMRRAVIPYRFIPDMPPEITLIEEPQTKDKGQMQLSLKVKDDYGVDDLTLKMRLDETVTNPPLGAPVEDKRAVMSPPGQEMEVKPLYDLAWHPWAGHPVVIEMDAIDHKKQVTALPPLHVTLPERTFSHPVAQKLILMRKRLARTPDAAAENIAEELLDIMVEPDKYSGNLVVFLSLRTMASRLIYDPTEDNIRGIISQMWDTALQIEEGNLAIAARDLRDAQRKLESVLNDPNATQEQIAQALDEFKEAMNNYFQEMVAEMQKQMAKGEIVTLPADMFSAIMNPEDLQNFMDELAAQSMAGNKDAAREMLSKMQQMLDQMNNSSGQMEMPKDMKFMLQGISELQKLIEKQEELLEQTKKQSADSGILPQQHTYGEAMPIDPNVMKELFGDMVLPQPDGTAPAPETTDIKPSVDTSKNKDEQEALRFVLGKLMQDADSELGEIPPNMGQAELEMRGSSQQLGNNHPTNAIPHQEAAIKHLKESMDQMSEKLAQKLKNMMAMSMGSSRMDPMGRPMKDGDNPSWMPSSRVKIPDEAERKRVREILDTIRRRSGELNRPDYELEYYRRLMQQF